MTRDSDGADEEHQRRAATESEPQSEVAETGEADDDPDRILVAPGSKRFSRRVPAEGAAAEIATAPAPVATFRSMPWDFSGRAAFDKLAELRTPAERRLNLILTAVERMDAIAAVTVAAMMHEHTALSPEHVVELWEPSADEIWQRAWNLLGPLPARSRWCEIRPDALRTPGVMLPGMVLDVDHDLVKFFEDVGIAVAGSRAGLPPRVSDRLRGVFAELVHNVRLHGNGPLVLSLAREQESDAVTLAMWDGGPGLHGSDDPVHLLRERLRRTAPEMGLRSLPKVASGDGWTSTVEVASSLARARFTDSKWAVTPSVEVPGFGVAVTVHPPVQVRRGARGTTR